MTDSFCLSTGWIGSRQRAQQDIEGFLQIFFSKVRTQWECEVVRCYCARSPKFEENRSEFVQTVKFRNHRRLEANCTTAALKKKKVGTCLLQVVITQRKALRFVSSRFESEFSRFKGKEGSDSKHFHYGDYPSGFEFLFCFVLFCSYRQCKPKTLFTCQKIP